jgi:hypothetical protein
MQYLNFVKIVKIVKIKKKDEPWHNNVFLLWSKLGLHYEQMPLNHGLWVLHGLIQKARYHDVL